MACMIICQSLTCPILVGDGLSEEDLQSSCAFLFQLLHDKKRVSATESLTVKNTLGPHSNHQLQTICDLIQR